MYDTGGRRLGELTIGVWGLGKMGLPLGLVLAEHGATVRGVDIDPDVVSCVNNGQSPIENEPEVPELVARHGGERLQATTHGTEAAEAADVLIILVPTVLDVQSNPNLDPVIAAATDIAAGLSPGDLVVLESTVPPGTTESALRERLETSGLDAGTEFGLAFCPERTSSGRVVRDLTESYPKVVGGVDGASTEAAADLYRQFNDPGVVEVEGATAAEAIKVFEGVYRDVNIALANELGIACEEWGLDADAVFDAANTQPFCNLHDPGIGVGGHCIPVYPHFVIDKTTETRLLQTARAVNREMPAHAVQLLRERLAGHDRSLKQARILVLGVAYRPGVNEIRYAPAVDAIDLLRDRGATVYAHDPVVPAEVIAGIGAETVGDVADVDGLNGIVLATGHQEYRELDFEALSDSMRTPVVVDGRRFFDPDRMTRFDYVAIGRARPDSHDVGSGFQDS